MPPEPDPRIDDALVDALEDYHRRAALGEAVPLGLYQERLGANFSDFQAVVRAEQALDEAMASPPEPTAEPLPRPFGPFTLVRELGRGGVGVVYEAVDRRLGRTLAVKVLKVSFDMDDVALERFRREASACARVRHDHIVPIFESGEIDGQPFYAMDLVPGESLSNLIRDGRAPEPRALCRGLANLADALQALHDGGVIHRDVKPQNVMVRPDGRMVLTDFGLARTEGAATLTQTGQALGTPLYMSPEQIHGDARKIVPATDVYGLGAVLYEALTGHPPFPMNEYPRLLYNVLHVRPEPPRALHPDVPEACERIALKALEKEPRDRYPTAAAMAADLRAFAEERPVLGRPLSRGVRAWRWVLRRKVPLGIAALALFALGWWWTHRPGTISIERGAPGDLKVSVDGSPGDPLPFFARLPAGEHSLVLRRPLFLPYERRLSLDAGELVLLPLVSLRPDPTLRDVRDRDAAAQLLARDLGLPPLGPEVPSFASGTRAPAIAPALHVLAPRGRVRASDVDRWWLELDSDAFVHGGRLELRVGERVLWSDELSPKVTGAQLRVCGSVPQAAMREVVEGMALSFRWTPPPGSETPAVEVELEVVRSDATARALAEVDSKLGSVGGAWRSLFRADVLRRAGLTAAALLEVRAAISADATDRRAWGSLLQLLQEDPDLRDTMLADDIRSWLGGGAPRMPGLCATEG